MLVARQDSTGPERTHSNRVDSALEQHAKVVHASARAIFPVYRTTPITALRRETGIPSPEIALDGHCRAALVRQRRLDSRHPLLRCANIVSRLNRPTSGFARQILALPCPEQIYSIAVPPWTSQNREASYTWIGAPTVVTKEEAKLAFLSLL
ncbi:hypothetical protein K3495_g8847 [Podosphaera aphanis]|nr:hypothetical protein K3495_g8847 [Podosphaera aphanis]